MAKLELKAGDHRVLRLTLVDELGSAFDLTGVTDVKLHAARRIDKSAVLQKTLGAGIEVVGDPTSGVVDVTLDPADTASLGGDYVWEFEVTDASGNPSTGFHDDTQSWHGALKVERQMIA